MAKEFGPYPPFEPHYIPFPNPPSVMNLKGHEVYRYVSEESMDIAIRRFSSVVKLKWFDVILVNQFGGDYFAKQLAQLQVYKAPMVNIEYHRDGRIDIQAPKFSPGLRVGVIDDIYDVGTTAQRILTHVPKATFLFLTEKVGVENQIPIPNRFTALKINAVWVGGCGLNLESENDGLPENFARDYPGLVVKIQQ